MANYNESCSGLKKCNKILKLDCDESNLLFKCRGDVNYEIKNNEECKKNLINENRVCKVGIMGQNAKNNNECIENTTFTLMYGGTCLGNKDFKLGEKNLGDFYCKSNSVYFKDGNYYCL